MISLTLLNFVAVSVVYRFSFYGKDLAEYREDLLEDKRFELKMAEIQKEINELRGPQTAPAPQPANTDKEEEE